MDCKTARLLLDFHRPHPAELFPDDADALEAHLAGCPDCDATARADRQLDAAVGPAVRNVPVPDGLKKSILERLQKERGDRQRRWLAWGARLTAAAAVIALAVWLGWALRSPKPLPDLDPIAVRDAIWMKYTSLDHDKVEKWFADNRGVETVAPEKFNYALLVHYDMERCDHYEGRQVPLLVFSNGKERARVFIIDDKQFNLPSQQRQDSGGQTMLVAPSRDPKVVYLIVYTGESLQAFRSSSERPAF